MNIQFMFTNESKFFRDKKQYVYAICLIISIVDIALFMCEVYQFRTSPALRVLIVINSNKQSQIHLQLQTLITTVKDFLVILPFLLTFYFMMISFIYRYF